MTPSQNIILWLRELNDSEARSAALAKSGAVPPSLTRQIDSLRARIPTSILAHHDRMRLRGKISVASVRRNICGACNLAIPVGHMPGLRLADDLNVCDHCGTFIFLAEEEQPLAIEQPAAAVKASSAPASPQQAADNPVKAKKARAGVKRARLPRQPCTAIAS